MSLLARALRIRRIRLFVCLALLTQLLASISFARHFQSSATLVALWRFDDASGVVANDSSGNGNAGTLQNGPTWVAGAVGAGALDFDGVNDSLSVPGSASINPVSNNFTVAFWAYPRASHEIDAQSTSGAGGVSGQRYVWGPGWYNHDGGGAGAGLSVGTNGVSVYEHASGYMPAPLVYQGTLSGWTHVALVYQNKQPRLYINGVLVRTGLTSPRTSVGVIPWALGGVSYGYYNGQLDDLRLYNGVLTEAEIKTLPGMQAASMRTPAPSRSLSLNGAGAYVSVPYSSSLNITGPITVEAWVKRNPGAYQAIVERYGANDGGYALRIEADRLCFYTLNNNHDFDRLVSNAPITTGVWHHVAAVFDGSQKQLWVDGVLDTSAATGFGPGPGVANLRVGVAGDGDVNFFSGLIDEVRVTAGVRYRSSFIPDLAQAADGSDARGLWNFDTQTADDSSGKDNHGSFVGGASCSSASPAGEKYTEWKNAQAQMQAQALPAEQAVAINFDNFAFGTIITTQYPPATFSSGLGQAPVVWTPAASPGDMTVPFSHPNTLTRFNNFIPNFDHFAPLTVEFAKPVNNLRFGVASVDALWGRTILLVDIYQNNVYRTTWPINSFGWGVNIFVNVGQPINQFGFNEVTKIVIRNIPQLETAGLSFDDFTFSVPETLKVDIKNPRVSGNIQNTVKPALLGADVRLQAVPNKTGGTYTWSVSGPTQNHVRVSTSADQTAILERFVETGTYRVTVNYSLNGETASAFVDVNVVAPTLSSFSAERTTDRLVGDNDTTCFQHGPSFGTVRYMYGCATPPPENPLNQTGITWTAKAEIAPAQYLSDPAQSGVKIVQIISALDKAMAFGSPVCYTARSSESNVQSGWQLDTTDPYDDRPNAVARFSGGASLTLRSSDTPSTLMTTLRSTGNFFFEYLDALVIDDYFETYVVYFTGDQTAPNFQRAIGFQNPANNPNLQVAYIPWIWAGKVFFDPEPQFFSPCKQYKDNHCLQSSTPTTNPVNAVSKACAPGSRNCMTPYAGNVKSLPGYTKCPGGPEVSNNMIDTPRYFVWRHYKDFYNRDPFSSTTPDEAGVDYWRGEITQCGFDFSCIDRKRVDVARAFFYSAEFIQKVPLLASGSRCTNTYNKEFVRQCYYVYLQRQQDPEVADPGGFNHWVSTLNNQCPTMGDGAYNEMLRAFIRSSEYRNRFPATPPLPW